MPSNLEACSVSSPEVASIATALNVDPESFPSYDSSNLCTVDALVEVYLNEESDDRNLVIVNRSHPDLQIEAVAKCLDHINRNADVSWESPIKQTDISAQAGITCRLAATYNQIMKALSRIRKRIPGIYRLPCNQDTVADQFAELLVLHPCDLSIILQGSTTTTQLVRLMGALQPQATPVFSAEEVLSSAFGIWNRILSIWSLEYSSPVECGALLSLPGEDRVQASLSGQWEPLGFRRLSGGAFLILVKPYNCQYKILSVLPAAAMSRTVSRLSVDELHQISINTLELNTDREITIAGGRHFDRFGHALLLVGHNVDLFRWTNRRQMNVKVVLEQVKKLACDFSIDGSSAVVTWCDLEQRLWKATLKINNPVAFEAEKELVQVYIGNVSDLYCRFIDNGSLVAAVIVDGETVEIWTWHDGVKRSTKLIEKPKNVAWGGLPELIAVEYQNFVAVIELETDGPGKTFLEESGARLPAIFRSKVTDGGVWQVLFLRSGWAWRRSLLSWEDIEEHFHKELDTSRWESCDQALIASSRELAQRTKDFLVNSFFCIQRIQSLSKTRGDVWPGFLIGVSDPDRLPLSLAPLRPPPLQPVRKAELILERSIWVFGNNGDGLLYWSTNIKEFLEILHFEPEKIIPLVLKYFNELREIGADPNSYPQFGDDDQKIIMDWIKKSNPRKNDICRIDDSEYLEVLVGVGNKKNVGSLIIGRQEFSRQWNCCLNGFLTAARSSAHRKPDLLSLIHFCLDYGDGVGLKEIWDYAGTRDVINMICFILTQDISAGNIWKCLVDSDRKALEVTKILNGELSNIKGAMIEVAISPLHNLNNLKEICKHLQQEVNSLPKIISDILLAMASSKDEQNKELDQFLMSSESPTPDKITTAARSALSEFAAARCEELVRVFCNVAAHRYIPDDAPSMSLCEVNIPWIKRHEHSIDAGTLKLCERLDEAWVRIENGVEPNVACRYLQSPRTTEERSVTTSEELIVDLRASTRRLLNKIFIVREELCTEELK